MRRGRSERRDIERLHEPATEKREEPTGDLESLKLFFQQAARYPLLLRVGLVAQLAARLTKQVRGLATGFGDHGLGSVFGDIGDVLAGIRRTVPNGSGLIFGDINRAGRVGRLAAWTGYDA